MPSRRKSRQRALQMLFLWDARRQPAVDAISAAQAIEAYYETVRPEEGGANAEIDAFAAGLLHGAVENQVLIDDSITRHAAHWRMERMPAVDRNILRLAVYEMKHGGTPAAVAIDEALELARRFSNEESVQFVNGVLDAIHREFSAGAGPAG